MKPPGTVALPEGVVTWTVALPAAPAGVRPVTRTPPITLTLVAGTPLKVTEAPVRLAPTIVNGVPPVVGPVDGAMAMTVGGGGTGGAT